MRLKLFLNVLGLLTLAQASAAQAPFFPCEGIVFSVETTFTSSSVVQDDGDPTVFDGDLLAKESVSKEARVCARSAALLAAFDSPEGLGLDAVDVLDAKNFLIAFSTENDHPEGAFGHGDLLFTNGGVLPNSALVYNLGLPYDDDLGLDAVLLVGKDEDLFALAEEVLAFGRDGWAQNPFELAILLEYLNADVYFSLENDVDAFHQGDLISARTGTVVASEDDLLGPGDRDLPRGLDAVTGSRVEGLPRPFYFSTELAASDEPAGSDGDLFEQANGVDLTHEELLAGYLADVEGGVGLDAFHAVVDAPLPEVLVTVDPAVTPFVPFLPDAGFGKRPLSAIADPSGTTASFVANEVVVVSDDVTVAEALAGLYGGEIVLSFDPKDAGVDAPALHLVRVDPSFADPSSLAADLTALDGGLMGRATGEHRIFDDEGLATLAIVAAEARLSVPVAVNWVGSGHAFPESSLEAAGGPSGYTQDATQWPYMNRGSNQDIGTADAWTLLDAFGRLGERVDLAVIDSGYRENADFPPHMVWASVLPFLDAQDIDGVDIDWHATNIMGVVGGQVDNQYGVAGSGAPVLDSVLGMLSTGDMFFLSIAVSTANSFGYEVMTISQGVPVPSILAWSVVPFDLVTRFVGRSKLIFASAGNEGTDVDGESCTPLVGWPCWESTWHTPCENGGVHCVGGLTWDSANKHANSNYGGEDVDVFGPYTVYGGPNPDNPNGAMARRINGTSYAAPYVAGVAALVWAADPGQSSDAVWSRMASFAHPSADPKVDRIVNAYDAVLDAIGEGGYVEMTSPAEATVFDWNVMANFSADAIFRVKRHLFDPPTATLNIRWISNRDGVVGTDTEVILRGPATSFSVHFGTAGLSPGTHVLTVEISHGSLVTTDTVSVEVRNTAPTVWIDSPSIPGREVCPGLVELRGDGTDPNEVLDDGDFEWRSSVQGFLGNGRYLLVPLNVQGLQYLHFSATDSGGYGGSVTTWLRILDAADPQCTNLPPNAAWVSPSNGDVFPASGVDAEGFYTLVDLVGQASDPEDGTVGLVVTWTSSVDGTLGTSTVDASGVTTLPQVRLSGTCKGSHTLTLRVTDSGFQSTTRSIEVTVRPIC